MQSAAKPQKLSRSDDFELLTRAVKAELADDHLSGAIGTFREAANLSRGLPDLEEAAVRLGIELTTQTLPLGARVAKSLLLEAAAVDSGKIIPAELWRNIHEQEREEAITVALSLTPILPAVRRRMNALLEQYPQDQRLVTRLKALDAPLVKLAPSDQKVAPESTPQPSAPANTHARTIEHHSPARTLARVSVIRRWTQTLKANPNLLSTAATLIFTVVALGAAGGLIWMNDNRYQQKATADDQAWSAVNPHNMDLVENYLMRFPRGAHRGQAVQALIEIRIERRQSAEMHAPR